MIYEIRMIHEQFIIIPNTRLLNPDAKESVFPDNNLKSSHGKYNCI